MPTEVRGGLELRKALKNFAPDLAKETQKELGNLLKPITTKARGFIPSTAPLSGWGASSQNALWTKKGRLWSTSAAKRGIGYRTTPSKPNRQGFRALARIVNASAAGAIYETAGRKNPNGQSQFTDITVQKSYYSYTYKRHGTRKESGSTNPNAGKQFIDALNKQGLLVDANNQTGAGRRSRKMKGRAIYRAWKEDYGKTNAAVVKAIEASKVKFYAQMGAK